MATSKGLVEVTLYLYDKMEWGRTVFYYSMISKAHDFLKTHTCMHKERETIEW